MTTTSEHLTPDEVDDALSYRLDDGPADHLRSCRMCQVTVEWHRMAKLDQLGGLDVDWYCKTLSSLADSVRQKGNGLVYLIPRLSYSRLVRMPFEGPSEVRIEIGPQAPLSITPSAEGVSPPSGSEDIVQRILERWSRGRTSYAEVAQQLMALGYELGDIERMLK